MHVRIPLASSSDSGMGSCRRRRSTTASRWSSFSRASAGRTRRCGAMMRATTRAVLRDADIVINPARDFGSFDWRKSDLLVADGYAAAEALKDKLVPLALDEKGWAAYQAQRDARRQQVAVPEFVVITGAAAGTREHMQRTLRRFVGRPLDVAALEASLEQSAGLDRYET